MQQYPFTLRKTLTILASTIGIILTTSCTNNNSTITQTAISDTINSQSPLLIYYEKNDEKVNCFKKELPNGPTNLIAQFDTIPLDVIWDTAKQFAYFVTPDGIFSKNYNTRDPLKRTSNPLPAYSAGFFGEAWIDKNSGRFCISYCILSYYFDETLRNRFKKLSEDTSNYLPDFGMDLIACIAELDESGNWKTTVEKASKGEACDTPGLEVLNEYIKRKETIISTSNILYTSSCYGRILMRKEETEDLDSFKLNQYFNNMEMPDVEGFFLVRVNAKYDLIASADFGDGHSPSYINPLFFYDKEKQLLQEVFLQEISETKTNSPSSKEIIVTKDYVLFANEYGHEKPAIFDAKTFEYMGTYPKASHSIIIE